jgi:imidazolonepropionase-like amidohydrolase
MSALRVRGRALTEGQWVDLNAHGDRWTTDPVPNAELVGEGWLLPGLVDAHTHPGAENVGQPLDEDLLRADLLAHLAAGVTLIRAPGLAGDPPSWFGRDDELPRAVHAGRWIAQQDQFLEGWGRRPGPVDMPAVAAEQAARTGWAKVIGDWGVGDPAIALPVLQAVVDAVHAVGGRLAMHSQQADGGAVAVAAGIDSLEHGMCLDAALLPEMARKGMALTPTLSVINAALADVLTRPHGPRRAWYEGGASVHGALAVAALEAGVTVLAGTDSRPHGRITDEVRALAAAGLPAHAAIGAASWAARSYLGLDGLVVGAPADVVVYDHDPRNDLTELDRPRTVVLRGRLSSSRT